MKMRSKEYLIKLCEAKGIKIDPDMKKKELEELLAPKSNNLLQIPVMKARDFISLSEEEQEEILNSDRWVAEEKYNGVHAKLHFKSDGIHIDGRKKSDVTFSYIERTDNFPHIYSCHSNIPEDTVFDCELKNPSESIDTGSVITKGTLTSTTSIFSSDPERAIEIQKKSGPCYVHVFDIIRVSGYKVVSNYEERRFLLRRYFNVPHNKFAFKEAHIYLSEQSKDKRELYSSLVKDGKEGIMLKSLDGYYEENKESKYMYKWKNTYTVDGFITGYIPGKNAFTGLIGSLEVSVYLKDTNKVVVIGCCPPGDMETRRMMTATDGSLKKEYYGSVVEVRGYDYTTNGRIQHAVLEKFRPDKNKEDCICDINNMNKYLNV
jgi:ATP-dependent DNA ligase